MDRGRWNRGRPSWRARAQPVAWARRVDHGRRRCADRALHHPAPGIYAADAETLSLQSTFPQFVEMEKRYGSVIRGLRASSRSAGTPKAGTLTAFASFAGGLEELVDGLRIYIPKN